MDRELRRKVEYAFYNYLQLRQRGAEYIEEIAEKGLTASYEGVGGAKSGNSVENRVIAGLAKSEAYKWAKVVEKTLEHFESTGKDTLIKLKYFDNLSEWKICDRLYIDRSVIYDWVNDVISYATMWGIQERLIMIK